MRKNLVIHKRTFGVVLFIFLIPFFLFSQDAIRYKEITIGKNEIDSLPGLLKSQDLADSEKILILNRLTSIFRFKNPILGLQYGFEATELEKKLGLVDDLVDTYNFLGNIYLDQGLYEYAMDQYARALNISIQLGDTTFINHSFNNIGYVFLMQGIYDLAISNFQEASKASIILEDQPKLALSYSNIGRTYFKMDQIDLALEFYEKSLNTWNLIGDSLHISQTYAHIGLLLAQDGNVEEALEILQNCVRLFQKYNDTYWVAGSYKFMGDIYKSDGQYNRALRYYNLSLISFKEFDSKYNITETLLLISDIKYQEGIIIEAVGYAQDALDMASKYNFMTLKESCYLHLSKIYNDIGDVSKSYDNYRKYTKVKDSIFSHDFSIKIADAEIQRARIKFEEEINLLERENRLEKIVSIFILICISLVLFLGFLLYLRYKAQKKAKELAEFATQTKTIFLAKMSHEIRTPLNGLISTTDILKKCKLTNEQKELVYIIDSSANRLMDIVNEILDLTKIESGKVELDMRDYNIRDLVKEVVNIHKISANEKGLSLNYFVDHEIPQILESDDHRIKKILSNLVSNAIKFTDKGSVKLIVNTETDKNKKLNIKFNVVDSGIGIAQEQQEKLFNEYSQADSSIERKYGGTGLGLHITQSLVNLMNGAIGFESQPGKGSSFWFTILLIEAKSKITKKLIVEKDKTPDKQPGKLNILLAEDNLINQKVTMIHLKNSGHYVEVADNGKIALDKFMENQYDVILMDIQMPEMDGLEATRAIRKYEKEHPERKKVRIIALTANVVSREADTCYKAGVDHFISKPFKPQDLSDALKG